MIRKTAPYAFALAAMLATPVMAQAQQASQQPQTTQPQANSTSPAGAVTFITKADPGQYRASQLVGVKIYNPQDENIGNVNELIVDKKGSIVGVVIGVGGFLGIGEKNVALPYSVISWVDMPPPAPDTTAAPPAGGAGPTTPTPAPAAAPRNTVQDYPYRGTLAMTKEQLQGAPDFKFASETATQ